MRKQLSRRPRRKNRTPLVLAVAFVLVLAAICGALYASRALTDREVGGSQQAVSSGTAKAPQTLDEQADAIVREMSLTEKVGQMVMIGVQGTDLTDDSKFMLRQFHIGGVLLFDRNLESAEQTKAFISHMQDYAQGEEAHQKVPLFIGIDEEGGDVVRGKSFIAPPPSQLEIGQTGDPGEAARCA